MDFATVRSLLRDCVLVKPQQLGSNYKDVVQHLLKQKLEGVCSRHGFLLPGSVELHRVVAGRVESISLNGDVRFDVQYFANVCDPAVGTILSGHVVNANRFGVLAHCGIKRDDGEFLPIIECIVTKQGVPGAPSDVDVDTLKAGDEVGIEVLGKKYELGDTRISVIGRAVPVEAAHAAAAARALPGQSRSLASAVPRMQMSMPLLAGGGNALGVEDDGDEDTEEEDLVEEEEGSEAGAAVADEGLSLAEPRDDEDDDTEETDVGVEEEEEEDVEEEEEEEEEEEDAVDEGATVNGESAALDEEDDPDDPEDEGIDDEIENGDDDDGDVQEPE